VGAVDDAVQDTWGHEGSFVKKSVRSDLATGGRAMGDEARRKAAMRRL
jgi:hypothetical protein